MIVNCGTPLERVSGRKRGDSVWTLAQIQESETGVVEKRRKKGKDSQQVPFHFSWTNRNSKSRKSEQRSLRE